MRSITNSGWTLGLVLSLALAVGLCAKSQASILATITPTEAADGPDGHYSGPDHLIDSSGLSGTIGVGDDAVKTHDATMGGVDMWVTYGNVPVDTEEVTFTLSQNYNLDGTYIWNYNEIGDTVRGVQTFTIDISTTGTDPGDFSPIIDPTTTLPQVFSLARAGGADGEPAQFLAFSAPDVTAVRFDLVTSYGSTLVGLSEVRFLAEVPEPASVGLLAVGGVMLLRQRRRNYNG